MENISLVKSQAVKKNIELSYPVTDPVMVKADIRMIDTILRNLLTNAIKFTEQGGQVVVSAAEKDSHVEVMVKDTGIGIEQENISRIFDLDNKYTRRGTQKERGSGLGLALCKEFAEKHKGTIQAFSAAGKGSSFIFTLPK
jgi:signal transduction histidine kinase